jgi:CheY-like chemotaxis protein
VELDDARLTQILVNLLGNAFKFTARGTVTLAARCVPGGRVRFEVRDTGCGIAPQDRERIFCPFEQAGGEAARQGTGLGLAISRRLVALLGGELRVESEPGQGSLFWFELPLTGTGKTARAADASGRVTGYAGARRRVLVVDDLAVNREVLTSLLESLGFEVRGAADGEAALRLAAEFDPHLVLLDLRMAPMDGFAVAQALRADPARAAIRIVAVSASAFDFDRGDAQRAGCDGFLAKPFVEEDLLAELQRQLGLEWRREEPPVASPPGRRPAPPVLEELRGLAAAGRIPRLRRRLVALRNERPECAGFCDELDALAAKFDLAGLAARLAP